MGSITTSNKRLSQFITNRVQTIKDLLPKATWGNSPTNDNPADLLTRGLSATQLCSSVLWKQGPPWLTCESKWATWSSTELSPTLTLAISSEEINHNAPERDSIPTEHPQPGIHRIIDIEMYSKLNHLLRVTAYVLRFIALLRKDKSDTSTAKELNLAERIWTHSCQSTTFPEEIENLSSKTSRRLTLIRQLRLFLDTDNLLRCGGRIHNAPLSTATKLPYLLPKNHPFTDLVVYSAHENILNSGVNSTMTTLRQTYWIPSIRQYVRKLLRRCVNCRKVTGTAYTRPDPPPLPKSRTTKTEPFTTTGVDFTGALYVRDNNGETKVYICLFTCAVTRAVHLEIVTDLSTECFLNAFTRFASRKSLPQRMISDNASTYLSAADELRALFNSQALHDSLSKRGVEWQFIPKRAPWFGGFWERLIGLTKTTLKKILGRTYINLEGLQTIIVEIEAVLNDRPTTYVTSEVDDPEPLTPSHLLYGRRVRRLPRLIVEVEELHDPNFDDDSEVRERAREQSIIIHSFWMRWRHEYLTSLREFHKTTGTNEQKVKQGDVCVSSR